MERNPTDRSIDELADRVGRFEASVEKRFDRIEAHFDRWARILGSAVVTIVTAVALKVLGVDL